MRAAIYVRISQDTTGEGLGVARQEKDCRALIERNGWAVAAVYNDNDFSAFSGKARPGYLRMLEDVEAGTVDAIVAWHPDRLHRNPRELEDFVDLVEACGTAVATATAGKLDLATPAGRMMARIVGAVARGESEHKSARMRRKHLDLAEGGAYHGGGRRSFGYEADGHTVNDVEAAEIRRMADTILAGGTLRGILHDLNARHVRSTAGGAWTLTTIRRLLGSARLSGQREHHGQIVAAATWPAIITPDETASLRAIFGDPDRRRRRPTRVNLLTGLVYCGRPECGARMTSGRTWEGRGKGYARYECLTRIGGCGKVGIHAGRTDDHVTDIVLAIVDGPGFAVEFAGRQGDRTTLAEIEVVEGRLAELAEAWADGAITRGEWQAARVRLEQQTADVRNQYLNGVRAGASADLLAARAQWHDPAFGHDRKRAIIEVAVERIVVAPVTSATNRFDSSRIKIDYRY